MPYIEREAVFKIVTDMMCDCKVTHKGRAIRRNIKQLPVADVVEVRHGEWISNGLTQDYVCSECSGMAPVDCEKEDFYESNYCPNCGADMRG